MAEIICAFIVGFFLGAIVLSQIDDLTVIHGKKDSFQTVDYKDKTYKLVPLDGPK